MFCVPRIEITKKEVEMREKQIHYIRVYWDSSTGSTNSRLISTKKINLVEAIDMIKSMEPKRLYKSCPDWIENCVRITISAQSIMDGRSYYKRVINIKRK